jgi:hypothetical protein
MLPSETKAADFGTPAIQPTRASNATSPEHESLPVVLDDATIQSFLRQLGVNRNVNKPTTFGPNHEYTVVPSVMEHKTRRGQPYTWVYDAPGEGAGRGFAQASNRQSAFSTSSTVTTKYEESATDSKSPTTTESIRIPDPAKSSFHWDISRRERLGNWLTRWFVDWWALEILSCVFSAVCMLVIVVILLKADGRELPKWNLSVSVKYATCLHRIAAADIWLVH